MVDIWGINVKGRKVPPTHPDPSYGPGVLTVIDLFGGGSHHMPLNFSSESNIDVKILEWEAKCDQNAAAILVIEAFNTIKYNDLYDFGR